MRGYGNIRVADTHFLRVIALLKILSEGVDSRKAGHGVRSASCGRLLSTLGHGLIYFVLRRHPCARRHVPLFCH